MSREVEDERVYRELETDRDTPSTQIAEIVADLESTDVTDLTPTYNCIDEVLANVFTHPPSSESQLEVSFSYESYRITVEQDGTGRFVKTE
jgi:hypothetical protein